MDRFHYTFTAVGLYQYFDSFIRQKYYGQKIIFDLSWSFGKAQQTKARKVGNLEEMSRTGSQGLGK